MKSIGKAAGIRQETMQPGGRFRALVTPYFIIAGLTLALMARGLLGPSMTQDSFWIDIVWVQQFTALLREGVLYPRWLPASFDGLGSPVFYFYGPVAFYVTGFFGLLGFSTYGSILAAFTAALFASGVAMFHWLRNFTGRALPGACLYMAAPYHLIDFYRRGALAEFTAFALIPVLALALVRAARNGKVAMLAVAYALLIATHLPIALLSSLLLILPFGIVTARRDRSGLLPLAIGALLGIGLAGIYLMPALLLQDQVSIEKLWLSSSLRVDSWNFLTPSRWQEHAAWLLFVCLTSAVAIPAAICFVARRDFWSGLTLFCCAVVAGLVPYFWSLPVVAKVQFPWRALAIAEFGVATALATSRLRPMVLLAAAVPMLALSALFLISPPPPGEHDPATLSRLHPDVPEYLPAGAPAKAGNMSRWALDLAAAQPAIAIEGDRTILRRFYFPAWQIRCGERLVPAFPDPKTQLISYHGRNCAAERIWTTAEIGGSALSLLSLLALVLALLRTRSGAIGSAFLRPAARRPDPR
jgi:hypothetical protein